MDDATAIDEAASVLTSPRWREENLFRMKDSSGDVGVGVDGALERNVPRERSMGWGKGGKQSDMRQTLYTSELKRSPGPHVGTRTPERGSPVYQEIRASVGVRHG